MPILHFTSKISKLIKLLRKHIEKEENKKGSSLQSKHIKDYPYDNSFLSQKLKRERRLLSIPTRTMDQADS